MHWLILCGLNLHRTFHGRNFWVFHLCLFVLVFPIREKTYWKFIFETVPLLFIWGFIYGGVSFVFLSHILVSVKVWMHLWVYFLSWKMLSRSLTIGVLLFLSSSASVLLFHKHETSIFFQTALRNCFFFHTMNDHSLKTCHWLLLEVYSHTFLFVVNRRQWIPERPGSAIWVNKEETTVPLSLREAVERPLLSHTLASFHPAISYLSF